ncbi:conserved hypothetical protein [Leishmania major strain Friedlin]|uniref:Uncharacterized protein n=1 Tax=Leishmania major TaxID=5664 RepID=Q4QIU0_LEIMA|nr:conserved hypothetical protein [Leishmania major strain Friedlin]CAG9568937.1 hypothetical_protein_-_conserved [Leishmania major strain Friedlin]CAJ06963.1 conserved hypothetical protein [Leishmania major strain Friedlin]|eukprot:XP_001680908.1 conserved hypothetical protein [Leishmania major strain Friedlin]
MSIDALSPLVACAARAAVKNGETRTIESSLDDLQQQMFGIEEGSHEVATEMMLKRIRETQVLLAQDSASGKSNLTTERLLLEAVSTLGELLLSAAAGQRLRTKTAKQMEDVILPILFLRTSVTPSLLKAHALKVAWSRFECSGKTNNEARDRLRHIFVLWYRNHGWDFARSSGNGVDVCTPTPTPHEGADNAKSNVEEKNACCSLPVHPKQQRVMLREISWNAAARKVTTSGIPSYLLTKRRRCDSTYQCDSLASARAEGGARNCFPAAAQPPSPTATDKATCQINPRILALDSPVKRRRRNLTVDVPPSPDRPE